jgi:hypothetical protein
VKRGKNDAADAEALCEAMNRSTMRFVPLKTSEQRATSLSCSAPLSSFWINLVLTKARSRYRSELKIAGHKLLDFGLFPRSRNAQMVWPIRSSSSGRFSQKFLSLLKIPNC